MIELCNEKKINRKVNYIMSKTTFHLNKTLKLTNVLKYRVLLDEENFDLGVAIEQMQSYIRIKGAMQIGPLIQYTKSFVNDNYELEMEIVLMLQCNNFIHSVEQPYSMESIIRVSDAMYCRYTGPENKLKFAYDKIQLEAFEADEELADCNYTIFVGNNLEDDTIVADVFIPRAK